MKIYLESLGCCRNQVDSEVMLGRLSEQGHEILDEPSPADVIIVNTCGFITTAADEAVDTILEMAEYKTSGACRRLVVTGCLPERFKDGDLKASLPEVDAFLGTGACDEIVRAVEGEEGRILSLFPQPEARMMQGLPLPRQLTLDYSAYVKVSEGCSRHCTYCIIPTLRGRQRSRIPEDVVREAETLALKGVREIILTGENTSDYGGDLVPPTGLADLFRELSSRIGAVDPSIWIRLLYTHPSTLNSDIIRAVAELPNVCTYFDVPIQHASTPVLKRMGRGYTREDLLRLFQNIRDIAPEASLRTTLITGFPGETEEDVQELISFIHGVEFEHLGVFVYSDSHDLVSHGFKDHVPEDVAMERHDRIMMEQVKISEKINRRYIGRTLKVLMEENPDKGVYLGRTAFQAPEVDGITFVYGSGLAIGGFADVKITDGYEYDLGGDLV